MPTIVYDFNTLPSATSVGGFPAGFGGGNATVQAHGYLSGLPNLLRSTPDAGSAHQLDANQIAQDGQPITFEIRTNNDSSLARCCYRMRPGSGPASITAYEVGIQSSTAGNGGVTLIRTIAGAENTLATIGTGTNLSPTEAYQVTITPSGSGHVVQLLRHSDGMYYTSVAGWSATQQNCINLTDTSGLAFATPGYVGLLWYDQGLIGVDLAKLTFAQIPAAITPASSTVVAGSTDAFTSVGFLNAVTYTSASTGVATVNSSTGVATGVAAGTSLITATDGTNTASYTITVTSNSTPTITPTTLTLNQLAVGSAFVATNFPGAVTFSSSAPSVVAINPTTGVPTAGSIAGTSTITATSGGQTATAVVAVPSVAITLSSSAAILALSGTRQFTATVTGTANTAVTYAQSGGASITTGGQFTALATAGTATVTVTSVADPTKSATATVTVAALSLFSAEFYPGQGYTTAKGYTGSAIQRSADLSTNPPTLTDYATGLLAVEMGAGTGNYLVSGLGVAGSDYVIIFTATNGTDSYPDSVKVRVPGPVQIDQAQPLTNTQAGTVGGALHGAWATAFGNVLVNTTTKVLQLFGIASTPIQSFTLDNATSPTQRTAQ